VHYSIKSRNVLDKASLALKEGGIAIIPTDTIFGLVSRAFDRKAVEKVYKVRGRNPDKPCIILCSSIEDLTKLRIKTNQAVRTLLFKIWPNPISIILPCPSKSMAYLHRGTATLAVRIPKNKKLRDFLKKTGPIIAPSANPEGKPPAKNIKEARGYFGGQVGIYVNGRVLNKPSTIISLVDGKVRVIRQGGFEVSKKLIAGIQ